ncbi:MAG TPA: glucosidase, partial [Patescibacteria group bacterium]|nr:glucosidase [Patescibacteria group bacterium]
LIPLFACEILDDETLERLPGFSKRMNWFLENRKDLGRHIAYMQKARGNTLRLLAVPSRERLERVLRYLLDEREFLSTYGIRSVSRVHREHPYLLQLEGQEYRVDYMPGESRTGLFGGNSNWRGPIWFPLNYLLIEALERYHHFHGDDLKVECPVGSGNRLSLKQVAREIETRLTNIFLPDASGHRPFAGPNPLLGADTQGRELVLFHEYFHGDTGRGLGASHQTGWTALAVRCMEDRVRSRARAAALGRRR